MPDGGYVVLLHGLSHNPKIMANLASTLIGCGFETKNLQYPSNQHPIEVLVDIVAAKIAAACSNQQKPLHIVAHSMGAIVTHCLIKKYRPPNLGRVVALGPPYHGTAIIDHLAKYSLYKVYNGPAALQLGTNSHGICHRLGTVDYELGVMAGDRYFFADWFFANYWLEKPNDGKVTVASTHIAGCCDHITLPVNHVHFPQFPSVIDQAAYFLENGRFQHN